MAGIDATSEEQTRSRWGFSDLLYPSQHPFASFRGKRLGGQVAEVKVSGRLSPFAMRLGLLSSRLFHLSPSASSFRSLSDLLFHHPTDSSL